MSFACQSHLRPDSLQVVSGSVLRPEDDPVSVEAGQHPAAFSSLPAEPPAGHVDFVRQSRQQPQQLHGQQRRGLRRAGVSWFIWVKLKGPYVLSAHLPN